MKQIADGIYQDSQHYNPFSKQKYDTSVSIPNMIRLTHIIKLSEPGRLFTFSDFPDANVDAPYHIFVSHATPAAIYELTINEHFNVRVSREYRVPPIAYQRFIGQDVISVNKKYIAQLIEDLEEIVQLVRIYYRDESNFAYGHSDIVLKDFIVPITSIHFLDFDYTDTLFIRSAFRGHMFQINDLQLMVDTYNFEEKFDNFVNQTYDINITAWNSEREHEIISTSFRITFADEMDMNSYYIGDSTEYSYGHSYGDPTFSEVVSDFYYGPDLKFNVTLKNSSYFNGSTLVLPGITPTKWQFEAQKLLGLNNCTSSFFNRFENLVTGRENIAFYCIQRNSLEKHIFDSHTGIEIENRVIRFVRQNFLDFHVTIGGYGRNDNDQLVILAESVSMNSEHYELHYFLVSGDLVTWRKAVRINIGSNHLRERDPMFEFSGGEYLILVDEGERRLFIVSRQNDRVFELTFWNKVEDLDFHEDLLFITHYNSRDIPVYKLTRYNRGTPQEEISAEQVHTFTFASEVHEFDTLDSNSALVFSGINDLEVWRIDSAFEIEYIRRLPFFIYRNKFEFYYNEERQKIAYARFDKFLFVIMISKEDLLDKRVFCFNMDKTSHDTLYSVITLDEEHTHMSNRIFIESAQFQTTIYIYVFYGGQTYQLIKFEPENLLKLLEGHTGEVFLPENTNNMNTFEPNTVIMELFPVYTNFVPSQNKSIALKIDCMNNGLKLEAIQNTISLNYTSSDGFAKLQLLEFFDGFDQRFSVDFTNNTERELFDLGLAQDSLQTYLLESINPSEEVLFVVEYYNYVLVFYKTNPLLQLFHVEEDGSVTRIRENFDYNELLNQCSIEFIKSSYILQTDDVFLIVNCRNYTNELSNAYQFKAFIIKKVTDTEIVFEQVFSNMLNAEVRAAALIQSWANSTEYTMVMLLQESNYYDTNMQLSNFRCITMQTCETMSIQDFTGLSFGFDNWRVNSFVFVRHSTYVIFAVSGFGFVVMDTFQSQVIQQISFRDLEFLLPITSYEIYRLMPIGPKGVRVFLYQGGSFSLYWDSTQPLTYSGDKLEGLYVKDRLDAINMEITTNLMASTRYGYVQVIYYPTEGNSKQIYLRVFNYFNRELSKNFREVRVDEAPECKSMDTNTRSNLQEVDIFLACGFRLYVYRIQFYPTVSIQNLDVNRTVSLEIMSRNQNSNQTMRVNVTRNDIQPTLATGFVVLIFFSCILLGATFSIILIK